MKVLFIVAISIVVVACSNDAPSIVPLASPAGESSGEPHLAVGPGRDVVLSWLRADGGESVLEFAVLESDRWVGLGEVARGDGWFVNWADFPSVVPIDGDRWIAHWLVRHPKGQFAYDVFVARSMDRGASWSVPRLLHDDGTTSEHGFVSIVPGIEGADVIWLDGRDIANGTRTKSMTLRAAWVGDAGIEHQAVVDGRVCDCCQTDAVRTREGLAVVYRDRSADEIRDISIVQKVAGRWSLPRRVARDGWRIAGCPVNGPAIDATGDVVAVAWPTGTGDDARVRLARSVDAGVTFRAPIDIDSQNPVGRVDVVQRRDGQTVVSWMRRTDNAAMLSFRTVDPDDGLGPVHDVAAMGAARASGFPQMVGVDDQLVFAWTDTGTSRVRTAVATLSSSHAEAF